MIVIKRVFILLVALILVSCKKAPDMEIHDLNSTFTSMPENESENSYNDGMGDIDKTIAENLMLLKAGDTKPLTGFALGDEIDYDAVVFTGDYTEHSRMTIPVNSAYDNLYLFFEKDGNRFSGIYAKDKGNFFGIILESYEFAKVRDILGEPDIFQEERDWDNFWDTMPAAIYQFKEAYLLFSIYQDKVYRVTYKSTNLETEEEEYERSERYAENFSERLIEGKIVETIYSWGCDYYDYTSDESEATEELKNETAYYDPRDGLCTEVEKDEFIKEYLQKRDTYKKLPDGMTCDNEGRPLVEYYKNNEQQKVSIIIHLWGDWLIDFDNDIRIETDALYCVTVQISDARKAGNLLYYYDESYGATHESLFDAEGKYLASLSYEYLPGVPLPFILEHENVGDYQGSLFEALCRNQKFWFLKKQARFDEAGRFTGYNGSIVPKDYNRYYIEYPGDSFYDEKNRLEKIEIRLLPYDIERGIYRYDNSGEIKFSYQDTGRLDSMEYWRSSQSMGSWDSSGMVYYDEQERIIHNYYYVTHGEQECFFLYEGDSTMPWAYIIWDSFLNGFQQIYIFR